MRRSIKYYKYIIARGAAENAEEELIIAFLRAHRGSA